MWFWKKKEQGPVDPFAGGDFDLVESLRLAAEEKGLRQQELSLSLLFSPGAEADVPDRTELILGSGTKLTTWTVKSLRPLFRGSRQPPPDSEMARYPDQYVPFFYRVESNVFRYCRTLELEPADEEFLDIYSQMKRLPDGKSMGRLHDVIWQSAALILGLRPWSEAEYTAVFGQLTRSARHFKIGPTSRNYIGYVRQTVGRHG
jgi:hypothetical protein